MADQANKTVQLTAPNGVRVTVSESKAEDRLAHGYTKYSKTAAKKAPSSNKSD